MKAFISRVLSLSLLIFSLTLITSQPSFASTNGCPSGWALSDNSFPISSTNEFVTAISSAGARAQATITQVNLPSLAANEAKQYLNIPLVTPNDLTPVLTVIDPYRAIILSGKPISVLYSVNVAGCTPSTKFEFKGQFPTAQVVHTNLAEFVKNAASLPSALKNEVAPEIALLSNSQNMKSSENDLLACQKAIEGVVAAGFNQKTGDSFPFSGLCPIASKKIQSVHLLAQSDGCLYPAVDKSVLDSPYVLPKGGSCKVGFALMLGQESGTGASLIGPSQIFLIHEFTLKSGAAASTATVQKLSNPELTQPAPKVHGSTGQKATSQTTVKPSKSPTSKQITITCVKGKNLKKVTGAKPQCPSGYQKK